MFTIAVDIGGTFTDVFVLDKETKRTFINKTTTTPDDLLVGVMMGLDEAAAQMGLNIEKLLFLSLNFIFPNRDVEAAPNNHSYSNPRY